MTEGLSFFLPEDVTEETLLTELSREVVDV
jgi:hypothetical protein